MVSSLGLLGLGLAEKLNASRAHGSKKRAGSLALLLQACLDDLVAAACASQRTTHGILDGKELWAQPRIRRAWHRGAGLFLFGCSRGYGL